MRLNSFQLSFIISSAIVFYISVLIGYPSQFLNSSYSETSEILNLSNEIINSTFPQIKTHNDNIYVIWSGNVGHGVDSEIQSDIFLAKSENKGNSFGESVNLSNNTGSSLNPQSETSSNNIYVVWEDDTLAKTYGQTANTGILFRQSKDNGTTFLPPISLSSINADSSNPGITAIKNDTVYVVWQDDLDESSKILYKKNISNNNTLFSDQQIISDNQGDNYEISPQIITSNDTVNIIWDDFNLKEGSSHIVKRSSIDGGITFSQPINLSNTTNSNSINPQLAATANELFVVWQEDISG
ncbi:MAG: hypothetical protein ACRD6U_06840, partial [Nitrososphaeraceae archaeon]